MDSPVQLNIESIPDFLAAMSYAPTPIISAVAPNNPTVAIGPVHADPAIKTPESYIEYAKSNPVRE